MYCTQCGNEIKKQNAKFCPSCGAATKGKDKKQKQPQKKSSGKLGKNGITIPIPALVLGVLGIIVVGFILMSGNDAPQQTMTSPEQQALRAEVIQVAEQFMCPCGDCNDNLAACDCAAPGGATEVKRFIQNGLEDGKTVEQMAAAVSMKYQVSAD
ncbi:MAG: zinc ribbon domain-containing protein [Candidatus Marinimicrobia bacterium]|nr:zinc ribbon domain-containing protein [Candidatus Neomarinimicrobiota bacterium]MCF7827652.1 zinc ribbon domain-containing protein [Candidatus Neomarinimicrobiota bacterium]MCF7881293.1 zinc ribbon domain-containing protein [Candidatus Neomarinimicrobiota bacterium]